MTRQMTGAKMVVQALKDQGVDTVFGYPGGAVLPIYDEIFQQNDIQHVLVRHEQGAVHAAEGYARSTGKPGVVLVTSGPGATNAAEAGGFVCGPLAKGGRPDVQLHFVPALLDDHGRNRMPGHGYTMHACVLRPSSRGEITLRDNNPVSHPRIDPRYLSHPDDWPLMIEAAKLSREIFAQAPFAPHRDVEILPGDSARSDQDMKEFIRAKAETIYHPVGTCAMGSGADAVVDW